MAIPGYIRDRLLRPIPPESCVKESTWPVIANGDPGLARIATVGLNPGGGAPYNDATAEEVWEGQKRYFQRDDVYRRYFSPLEKVLNECEASYYDGSACNLDLVCWATCPRDWSKVPPEAREKLIERDREFLVLCSRGTGTSNWCLPRRSKSLMRYGPTGRICRRREWGETACFTANCKGVGLR